MTLVERAVFDCNVLLQGLISPRGPAHQLLDAVKRRQVTHFVSKYVVDEFRDVASRRSIQQKYRLTDLVVERFCAEVVAHSTFLDLVPHVFDFPRDPDDAHYVDLALAADAKLIVSRDKDLLSLRDATTLEGRDFLSMFPGLSILTPPEALRLLDTSRDIA